jgi:hypothetical protein
MLKTLKPYYKYCWCWTLCIKSSNLSVLGTRSKTRVFSILSSLSILLSILSPSLAGRGLTVRVGRGFYKGIELYIESNAVAR